MSRVYKNTYSAMIIEAIQNTGVHGWTFISSNADQTELEFSLTGTGSPYADRVLFVRFIFTDEQKTTFPFCFPLPGIVFLQPIFHPNVDSRGYLSIIADGNIATTRLFHIMLNVNALLTDPDPYCFINEHASALFLTDREEYLKIARQTS